MAEGLLLSSVLRGPPTGADHGMRSAHGAEGQRLTLVRAAAHARVSGNAREEHREGVRRGHGLGGARRLRDGAPHASTPVSPDACDSPLPARPNEPVPPRQAPRLHPAPPAGRTYLCPDSWAMVKASPSPVSSLMVQLRYLLHIPLMGANPAGHGGRSMYGGVDGRRGRRTRMAGGRGKGERVPRARPPSPVQGRSHLIFPW